MSDAQAGPVIFISAGEPSGDLHGAGVARALKRSIPNARLMGLGGPLMAAEGVELMAELDELAVMGFVEVLAHLPFFLRLRKRVFRAVETSADLVIPIDYPGFNLRLARHARGQGVPVLYYIAPQVWAWHTGRVRQLAEDCDRVAVILPFEEKYLAERGVQAEFVGHPLRDLPDAEESPAAWRRRHGMAEGGPLLAIFPGSRAQEVRRHLELFGEAGELLKRRIDGLEIRIAAASSLDPAVFESFADRTVSDTRGLLRASTAALVKSGTTTLEAALAGTPFVVAYRMNAGSYAIARRLVDVPHIALANLVADRRVVPEFVQDAASPQSLADALEPLLTPGTTERAEMQEGLAEVRQRLGGGGAAKRVAEIAAELLDISVSR